MIHARHYRSTELRKAKTNKHLFAFMITDILIIVDIAELIKQHLSVIVRAWIDYLHAEETADLLIDAVSINKINFTGGINIMCKYVRNPHDWSKFIGGDFTQEHISFYGRDGVRIEVPFINKFSGLTNLCWELAKMYESIIVCNTKPYKTVYIFIVTFFVYIKK